MAVKPDLPDVARWTCLGAQLLCSTMKILSRSSNFSYYFLCLMQKSWKNVRRHCFTAMFCCISLAYAQELVQEVQDSKA